MATLSANFNAFALQNSPFIIANFLSLPQDFEKICLLQIIHGYADCKSAQAEYMQQLEIFKEGVVFRYWGELYAGCKAQWISPRDVLNFCENDKIRTSNAERYMALYLALDDSLFSFYEQVKSFIIKDKDIPIVKNEDELENYFFYYISHKYFRIWELEFLLRIKKLSISDIEKLEEIASVFDKMNYPEQWKRFLYYQPQGNRKFLNFSELYYNFLSYVEQEIQKQKS